MSLPEMRQRTKQRSGPGDEPLFQVPVRRLLWALVAIAGLLVLAHLAFSINFHHLRLHFFASESLYVLFDFTGEVTVPTWYEALLLFTCSVLLAGIAALARRFDQGWVRHWAGLSVILLLLSMDESADIHGEVSYRLQTAFETGGALAYPWVVPAAVFVLVVGMLYLRFVLRLERRVRLRVVVAGVVYVIAALGLEVVQAVYDTGNTDTIPFEVAGAIEEGLEMLAIITFISALVLQINQFTRVVRVTFVDNRHAVASQRDAAPTGWDRVRPRR